MSHVTTAVSLRNIVRPVRRLVVLALGIAAVTAIDAGAQTVAPAKRFELLVSSGSMVPTGVQRDAVKRANLTVGQFIYVARPAIAIAASLGWARTRDLALQAGSRLNVFTYDLGAEFRGVPVSAGKVTARPFVGAGAGARTYDYRSADSDARHNASGYASVGGELRYRRIGLRVEARDYVTSFKPLTGGDSAPVRNDIVFMAGLRFGLR
jgi:hypothetical protein